MSVSIRSVDGDEVTLEVKIRLSGTMLEAEESILAGLNEAGCVATGKASERFDTDGSRLAFGSVTWFSKGRLPILYGVGLADGAKANGDYLKHHTTVQVLDFYPAAESIAQAAWAAYPRDAAQRALWTETRCHDLKHQSGAATRLLKAMEALRRPSRSRVPSQRPRTSHHLLSQPQTSNALCALPRAGISHRLGRHGSRLQNLGEATSLLFRYAMGREGCAHRAQSAGVGADQRTPAAILDQDQSIRIYSAGVCLEHQTSITPKPSATAHPTTRRTKGAEFNQLGIGFSEKPQSWAPL